MLLNIVTDDQLLTGQIVKTILLVILAGGIILNVSRILRSFSFKKNIVNLIILITLSTIFIFVIKAYLLEAALLRNYVYVPGITIGYCNVFAEGRGISFEYDFNGKKFHNCNTFHPLSSDSIIVPNGKYRVRVAKKFPEKGRMDFQKPFN